MGEMTDVGHVRSCLCCLQRTEHPLASALAHREGGQKRMRGWFLSLIVIILAVMTLCWWVAPHGYGLERLALTGCTIALA
jgi:hypothetical protein